MILAFSLGIVKNQAGKIIRAGGTNRALASWINTIKPILSSNKSLNISENDPIVILSQWEIADILESEYNINVNYRAIEQNNEYLTTKGVCIQYENYCNENNIDYKSKSGIIVCHPDHFARCKRHLLYRNFNIMNTRHDINPIWTKYGCDMFGYDPNSTQEWTRSRLAFLHYELTHPKTPLSAIMGDDSTNPRNDKITQD